MGLVGAVPIVGALRVKNEARWLARVLESIEPLCDDCFVFDDHSTDGTPEIARQFGANVIESAFDGLDEGRDKDCMLDAVLSAYREPWVLCIDGDEILAPGGAETLRGNIESGAAGVWALHVRYLWDSETQWRTDGVYGKFSRPSLFHARAGQRFQRTSAGGNFHCGNVPTWVHGKSAQSEAALLHLGYMLREDRVRKYEWYNRIDGKNALEDGYRHMVVGDVFPAHSVFRYGGPLKLEALCTQAA